jgi:ribosomal protein S18 acetylase RimI-like enzyme
MRTRLIKSIRAGELSLELCPCDGARDGPFIRAVTKANLYSLLRSTYGWDEQRHKLEPKQPEQYTMVRRGEGPIGFVALRDQTDCLYLFSIQLVPEARGAGIGTSLMHHVEEVARATGHRTIRLRVFHANRAASLYRRLGYVIESSDEYSAMMRKLVGSASVRAR